MKFKQSQWFDPKRIPFTVFLLSSLLFSGCVDDKTAPASDVAPQTVAVSVTPQTTTLPTGGEATFSATVSGSGNTAVKWHIQEGASGGAVTSKGEYTAPATAGTFHLVATSQADGTKTATATVTVSSILDASFGVGGKTAIAFNGISVINAMARQPDGRLIAAGSTLNGTGTDFALARYNTDGSLDTTFGTGGIVITSLGGSAEITDIKLQNDGKIVAGGNTSNTENSNFAVARYLATGSLDSTFGGAGFVKTNINPGNDKLNALVIQANGKIVAGGFSAVVPPSTSPVPPNNSDARNKFALVRYNTDGTLDAAFGTGGMLTTVIGTSHEEILALTIDGSGKIVAGGFSSNGANNDFALARYLSDGTLDITFDTDGKTTTTFGGSHESIRALAVDSSGRIVAGGFASNGINNDFALARYDTNGALDGTFGTGGRVTTSFGTGVDEIESLVLRVDNSIVAAGFSFITGNNDFTLARFDSNGALDATFGAGGKVITAAGAGDDHIHAVALQTDGKIVAGGFSFSGTSVDFALARYNTDGSLDTNTDADPGTHFDTDGTLTTAVGGGADEINAIAVQTDNKIITAGFTFGVNNIRNKDFALSRLNADGTLDTTFGTSGKVTTAIGNADSLGHDVIHALALQTDGKIVAGGHTHNAATGDNFMLARYDTGGVLDPGFGTGGLVQTPINANDEEVNDILLQTDGKIIAAGTSFTNEVAPASSHHDFTVARYNANGTLDAVFGTGGIVKTPIGLGSFADTVRLQTEGKIVVAGSSENAAGFDFAVVRYNTNGTLDTTFDADGIVTTEISTGHDFAKAVQIQSDGKIVVAGATFPGGGPEQFALVRYNSDGSLDTSFGVNGVATTSFANGGQAFALQIQSDGKILAGGFSNSAQNSRDFTLARFLSDGTLDTGFGVGGIEISPFSGGMDEIHDLIVLSNGNLLAAGFSTNGHGENTDFHLARYAP